MAKAPADKQRVYIAKKEVQYNEKHLQGERLGKKNRLLNMKKENWKKYEEYLKREWEKEKRKARKEK